MTEGGLPRPKVPTTPQDLASPEEAWSQYFGDETETQYMLNDIRQRHLAVLLMDGEAFFWLKRKLSGTQCPYWSDESGQCRKPLDEQAACYNTRYVGGYEAPMEIKVGLPTAQRANMRQEAGVIKVEQMRPWTIWTPELTNGDLLVKSRTGERYEALSVTPDGPWRGLWVAQFFDMRALQMGADFAFNVPVTIPGGPR